MEERWKEGGSTRENGAVRRRFRMPIRFLVGERPAGAERGTDLEVLMRGAGERAVRIGLFIGEETGFKAVERSGDAGARVRK